MVAALTLVCRLLLDCKLLFVLSPLDSPEVLWLEKVLFVEEKLSDTLSFMAFPLAENERASIDWESLPE